MKVVFMGTPEFALPALERLLDSRHEVVLVVTRADQPRGRGQQLEPPPVKVRAEACGLSIAQPQKLLAEGIDAKIRELGADVAVVAAYGKILPKAVLEAPRLGCLNIHPSLLPAWRGAAPIQRSILEGETETGVTIMQLVQELDAGPIVAQQRVPILDDDDARSLGNMLATVGADMMVRVLDEAERSGTIDSVAQDDEQATYAEPITKQEGLIPWDEPTERIMYRLRAMTPWPGAYTFIGGERQLTVLQAEPLWENEAEALGELNKAPMGTVTSIQKGFGFTVRTGDGHLLVTQVKPQGKKEMDAVGFVNGRGIAIGDLLSAPKV